MDKPEGYVVVAVDIRIGNKYSVAAEGIAVVVVVAGNILVEVVDSPGD